MAESMSASCLLPEEKNQIPSQNLPAFDDVTLKRRLQENWNDWMDTESALTHAYLEAKSNFFHGVQQFDALLLRLRLAFALEDLDEVRNQNELCMLMLSQEKHKAGTLKNQEVDDSQNLHILELDRKVQSLKDLLKQRENQHRIEIAKLKSEYRRIESIRKHEVSALLRERDFVWNQLHVLEQHYIERLRKKDEELHQALIRIETLDKHVLELQQAYNEKNDGWTRTELGQNETL